MKCALSLRCLLSMSPWSDCARQFLECAWPRPDRDQGSRCRHGTREMETQGLWISQIYAEGTSLRHRVPLRRQAMSGICRIRLNERRTLAGRHSTMARGVARSEEITGPVTYKSPAQINRHTPRTREDFRSSNDATRAERTSSETVTHRGGGPWRPSVRPCHRTPCLPWPF